LSAVSFNVSLFSTQPHAGQIHTIVMLKWMGSLRNLCGTNPITGSNSISTCAAKCCASLLYHPCPSCL